MLVQHELSRTRTLRGIGNGKVAKTTVTVGPITDEAYVTIRDYNESIFDEHDVPERHRAAVRTTMKLFLAAIAQGGEWCPLFPAKDLSAPE